MVSCSSRIYCWDRKHRQPNYFYRCYYLRRYGTKPLTYILSWILSATLGNTYYYYLHSVVKWGLKSCITLPKVKKRAGFTPRAIWLIINDPDGTDKYRNREVFNNFYKGILSSLGSLILLTLAIIACLGLVQNPNLQLPYSGPPDQPLITLNSVFPTGKQCLLTDKREENNHSYRRWL